VEVETLHNVTKTGNHIILSFCGQLLLTTNSWNYHRWMNTYLQDGAIFCNHSGILNQLMIDN